MARLDQMPEPMQSHLAKLPCPSFESRPWVSGKPFARRRISLISTAGLQKRGDRPFEGMTGDYRVIPGDIKAKDLVISHISTNFDRTGFQRDWNLVFPLERLRSAFKREIAELRPWYDLSLEKRDRTAVVEFSPDSASELLCGFAVGRKHVIRWADLSMATALRLAAQDLKAFYFEAATARPGSASPSSGEFSKWFWQETAAGRILKAVKERCLKEEDESLRKTGAMLLVPLDQA